MKRGRFSNLLQKLYTSDFGLLTVTEVVISIACACSTFSACLPKLLYKGQLPDAPLYNKNPPTAVLTKALIGCLLMILLKPFINKNVPIEAEATRSGHPTLTCVVMLSGGVMYSLPLLFSGSAF